VTLESLSSVSVIVPLYNGARVIAATLDEVQGFLENAGINHQIIVVDDGSRDASASVVQARGRGVRLLRNIQNRGKGYSVARGMMAATGAWRVFLDADNSTRIDNLSCVADLATQGAAVVIGSRRAAGSNIVRKQHPIRRFLGNSAPMLTKLLALPDLSDTQCGFKAFRGDVAEAVFSRLTVDRFMFDVEALLLARRLGYTIHEMPVAWDNPTESTLRVSSDTPQMIGDLLKTVWRLRQGAALPPVVREAEQIEGESVMLEVKTVAAPQVSK
jgi:dolichyl-phosphate beta-glucosyltransferase